MSAQAKKKTSAVQFVQQVRQEVARVSWPTSKEVIVTSVLVFFMVLAFALFFIAVDSFWGFCVRSMLGWGA